MKNNGRLLAGLLLFSLAAGVAGTMVIYKFFPKYLFHTVYMIHESGTDGEMEDKNIAGSTQYTEHFYPKLPYLKSIVLHMGSMDEVSEEIAGNMAVDMKLLRDDGKVLAQSSLLPEPMKGFRFQEFPMESWVESGREYRAVITFPDRSDLYITSSLTPIGPGEHAALEINGEESGETLYIQYRYGTYSKKLLAVWFAVFFMAAFMIGEYAAGKHRK